MLTTLEGRKADELAVMSTVLVSGLGASTSFYFKVVGRWKDEKGTDGRVGQGKMEPS